MLVLLRAWFAGLLLLLLLLWPAHALLQALKLQKIGDKVMQQHEFRSFVHVSKCRVQSVWRAQGSTASEASMHIRRARHHQHASLRQRAWWHSSCLLAR
jgi:predicted XRE-type DNA-binding protein